MFGPELGSLWCQRWVRGSPLHNLPHAAASSPRPHPTSSSWALGSLPVVVVVPQPGSRAWRGRTLWLIPDTDTHRELTLPLSRGRQALRRPGHQDCCGIASAAPPTLPPAPAAPSGARTAYVCNAPRSCKAATSPRKPNLNRCLQTQRGACSAGVLKGAVQRFMGSVFFA